MESLYQLTSRLNVSKFFNTSYKDEFGKEFPVGETIRVPFPQRWLVTENIVFDPQDINRRSTTITVDKYRGVHFSFNAIEKALNMGRSRESVEKEYISPAMSQLAVAIDRACALHAYENTSNVVGILGTNPTSTMPYLQARQRLFEHSVNMSEVGAIISPGMNTSFVGNQTTVFNPSAAIGKQHRTGRIAGPVAGFDFFESNSLYQHTSGAWAGTVELAVAPVEGATTLTLTATAGDIFEKNDIIDIATGFDVNPEVRGATSTLKQFRVTERLVAAGGGVDVLKISPALHGPGSQIQNISAFPAIGADLTLNPGTGTPTVSKTGVNGLAMGKTAFALVGVKMENPKEGSVQIARQEQDPNTGISIAVVQAFDFNKRSMGTRIETLFGLGNLYNDEESVRIAGA